VLDTENHVYWTVRVMSCLIMRTMSYIGQRGPCHVLDSEDHVMCWTLRTMSYVGHG